MFFIYNNNFDEDNYFNECNNNIYDKFNCLLDDDNSLGKKSDFSYDALSYNNYEYIKENQNDLIQGEMTNNLSNFKINNNNKEFKPTMPTTNPISNIRTNFLTNQIKKKLIFNIIKEKKKTHLGRKRKNNIGGKHNKFSQDNIARKIKTNLFENILLLLNTSIKNEMNENEENEFICSKFLLKIDQEVIKDINTINNKKLLKTKLKDIFYLNKVSLKYINYGLDYTSIKHIT